MVDLGFYEENQWRVVDVLHTPEREAVLAADSTVDAVVVNNTIIESSMAAVGKRGRGASRSSWLVPGNRKPGYSRRKLMPSTGCALASVRAKSVVWCAIPPRNGWKGPSTATG